MKNLKKLKKSIAGIIALSAMVAVLPGCGEKKNVTLQGNNYTELISTVSDSSELPDWEGEKLNLKIWYAHGTGGNERTVATNDVVTPEIERITGVKIDAETSYDNGGNTFDAKLSMIAAANDYPDAIMLGNVTDLKKMIEADKLWDITELFEEHCPNILRRIPKDSLDYIYDKMSPMGDGKLYFVPGQLNSGLWTITDPDADPEKMAYVANPIPRTDYTTIYVRDDILKKIYPNVKSQDEVEQLYMEKGTYTKEDIFDIPVTSKEEFIEFLYKIKEVIDSENLTEDNKKVEVTYAACGQDNWGLLACLESALNGTSPAVNYFTYFDNETKKIEYMFNKDWFKADLQQYRKLVADGVMSKESLLDNRTNFTTKVNNGLYAVLYGMEQPDEEALKAAGKKYRYRRIYLDIPVAEQIKPISNFPDCGYGFALCKDTMSEEKVVQVLKWIDFLYSEVGEKLQHWGPKSAGLFKEESGQRSYIDKAIEENMVYGVNNGKNLEYGLINNYVADTNAWPQYPHFSYAGAYHPRATYERENSVSDYKLFYNPGMIEGYGFDDVTVRVKVSPNLWNFSVDIPEVETFWNSRDLFEKELTKLLAASDTEFEKKYNELIAMTEKNGLTSETLDKINSVFAEKNKDYMNLLK